jgi:hypothetical protein
MEFYRYLNSYYYHKSIKKAVITRVKQKVQGCDNNMYKRTLLFIEIIGLSKTIYTQKFRSLDRKERQKLLPQNQLESHRT